MSVHMLKGRNIPVTNEEISNVYAEANLVTAGVSQWISPLGGTAPSFPSDSGELISLVSASALDVGVPIQVIGLDVNFKAIKEIVVLNGLVPVITKNLYTRINSAAVLLPGIQGQVLLQNVAQDTTFRCIQVATQYSPDSVATIAAGKKAEFEDFYFAVTRDTNAQSIATGSFHVRFLGLTPFFVPIRFSSATRGTSISDYTNPLPQSFEGPIDIYMTAVGSDNDIDVVSRIVVLELAN